MAKKKMKDAFNQELKIGDVVAYWNGSIGIIRFIEIKEMTENLIKVRYKRPYLGRNYRYINPSQVIKATNEFKLKYKLGGLQR